MMTQKLSSLVWVLFLVLSSGPQANDFLDNYLIPETENSCETDPCYDSSCPDYDPCTCVGDCGDPCSDDPCYDSSCPDYDPCTCAGDCGDPCSDDPCYDSSCPDYDPCTCAGDCGDPCEEDPCYDSSCPDYDPCTCAGDCGDPCEEDPCYDSSCPDYDPCTCAGDCGDPCEEDPCYDSSCPDYDPCTCAGDCYDPCEEDPCYDSTCPDYDYCYCEADACSYECDTEPPVAKGKDLTVYLDENGSAGVDPWDADDGSTDNCEVVDAQLSQDTFTGDDLGANTVTFTVTDVGGNTDDTNITITVKDTIKPNAVCKNNVVITLNNDGTYTLTPAEVDGGSSDNVGIDASVVIPSSFDCGDLNGLTEREIEVTLHVRDASNNRDHCTTTITLKSPLDVSITASDNPVFSGTEVTLTANVTGGTPDYHYRWIGLPPGQDGLVQEVTVTVTQTTTFYVEVDDESQPSCPGEAEITVTVLENINGTQQDMFQTNIPDAASEIQLELWPNPGKGQYYLRVGSLPENTEVLLKVLGVTGKLLKTSTWKPRSSTELRFIDLSEFQEGIYWLQLQTPATITTAKLILLKE